MSRRFIALCATVLFAAGFGLGVWGTVRHVKQICTPGTPWITDGVEYQCTVTVRPKAAKLML